MSSCMSQNEVADFMFLPTYSPDYNPIEEAFHQVKSYLKRHYPSASRIVGGRRLVLWMALACVTPRNARGYFRNAGIPGYEEEEEEGEDVLLAAAILFLFSEL